MSAIQDAIIQEAWSWVSTPYVDHAGVKGSGVDCAFFPTRVYQSVGLIPLDYEPPKYSPQQWINSASQTDKFHLKHEDTTMLNEILRWSKKEITEAEVQAGDLMVVKILASWTHAAIVLRWPEVVLHPLKGRGVVASHALKAGFWANREKRYFRFF